MTFKDGGRRSGGAKQRQRLTLFDSRNTKPKGVVWPDVDSVELRGALAAALSMGATVSFSPAAGGAGAMVKIYQGDYQASEFAADASQLNELLAIVLDNYQSGAEDIRATFHGMEVLAAD